MKKLLFLLLFLAPVCYGQGVRYDSQVTQEMVIAGVPNAIVVSPQPQIAFCNAPANAVPCTNKATTYTDSTLGTACPTSTQIVLSASAACVGSPDAQGNWGVWVPGGQYTYTISVNGANFGPFFVTAGGSGGTILSPVTVADTLPCALTPISIFTVCSSTTIVNGDGQEEIVGNPTDGYASTCWSIAGDQGNTGTMRGTQVCAGAQETSGGHSGMFLAMFQNGRDAGGLTLQANNGVVPGAEESGVYGIVNTNALTEAFYTPDGGIELIATAPGFGTTIDQALYLTPTALGNGTQGTLLISATAPTIAAAGCGGAAASITHQNGTGAFRVGIGTSNTGTCTITMPTSTSGWNCSATNLTTKNTNQASVQETSASGLTTLVLQNYTDVMGTHAMTDNDVLSLVCTAD